MRKWLGRILTTLSLLLLIGTVSMWARSRWVMETVGIGPWASTDGRPPTARGIVVSCYRGSVAVEIMDLASHEADDQNDLARRLAAIPGLGRHTYEPDDFRLRPRDFNNPLRRPYGGGTAAGFGWESGWVPRRSGHFRFERMRSRTYPVSEMDLTVIAVPWWFLALGFALAPARAAYRWRRARRRRGRLPHHCPACGYDCRATPDGAGPVLPACPECGRPTAATG